MKKFSNKKEYAAGFTLIEIMVSLSIFTIVAVVAVGAFLKIISADKQAQSLQTAMNNVNFALDSMVREMRVGSHYYCFNAGAGGILPSSLSSTPTRTCNSISSAVPNPGIAFVSSTKSSDGNCNLIHAYIFSPAGSVNPNTLEKAEQTSCGQGLNYSVGSTDFIPLVSADLNIQSFGIEVDGGSGVAPNTEPKAFFLLRAYAGPTESSRTYFTVQTTVSQRSMTGT